MSEAQLDRRTLQLKVNKLGSSVGENFMTNVSHERPHYYKEGRKRYFTKLADPTAERELALKNTLELLELFRQSSSDTSAYRCFLKANTLSLQLKDLGMRKEALELSRIHHFLIQSLVKSKPGMFESDLAMSLNNCQI